MLRAAFIGIDKHLDARIRELTGARRDATALWALFADSIPNIDPRLLTDSDATRDAIRRTLQETLGAAQPDDTVILSFSGHGTHDHQLVAHDTLTDVLADTTIPMEELATFFTQSQAKAILCILDCCFSGGAPARVLEDSPIPRDPGTPIEALAGRGRIIIAASNIDEPAWELPGHGHGLLTKALVDVLQSPEVQVSLPTAMDRVMTEVRAQAVRLGLAQTPVLYGYVEGGLSLPSLKPGTRFFSAFPETRGARIGPGIDELTLFGLPQSVLTEWRERFKGDLNDLQVEAVNERRILDGASLLVVAPTSAGKTFIGEMAAIKAVLEGRKGIFLLPYRALVNEKYDQFVQLYRERLGMRVVRCTGDYLDQTGFFVRGKYDLALLTYEMFLNLLLSNPHVINQIALVVLDEAQFITDPSRGITVELLLTYLIAARERGISPQLIALSAVIGNINDFDSWIGCSTLVTARRPVPLTEGVLDRTGTFQFLDDSGNQQLQQLLPPHAVQVRRDDPSAQDVIVPLVQTLVATGEKVIVFRNRRGPSEGCAAYLARDLDLPSAADVALSLPGYDLSTTSASLRTCMAGGTAFHNSNLSREERAVVERAFRDPETNIRVLAATTTVAAGINTPASTVILAEQEFIGEDGRPFTVAEYKNMAGRAGRLGFRERGKSIILADNAIERDRLFRRYVLGQVESLQSSFEPQHTETWVIRLLAQVRKIRRQDVVRLLANTYGGYLAAKAHPEWQVTTAQRLEQLLEQMVRLGLVEQEHEDVRLTLLGRACAASALTFSSALRLVELLRTIDVHTLTAERLMAVLQILPESDGGYTPMMRRGRSESVRPREVSERFGPDISRLLQRHAENEIDYWARCKRAALLWDWISGVPIEEIERRYTPNPFQGRISHGDIRKFADITRFYLRSAHQIASTLFVGAGPAEESVETLLKQLELGLPADALGLLALPLSLSRGEYLALLSTGIRSPENLWSTPPQSLIESQEGFSLSQVLQTNDPGVPYCPQTQVRPPLRAGLDLLLCW